MKITKSIILLIILFSTITSFLHVNAIDAKIYKNQIKAKIVLSKSEKGKVFIDKVNKIINKYSSNQKKLEILKMRIEQVKEKNKAQIGTNIFLNNGILYLYGKTIITIERLNKNDSQNKGTYKEITINKDSFGGYPAVLFNLRDESIMKISREIENKNLDIDSDLWIEPGDPEIMGLNSSNLKGNNHIGEDVKVLEVNTKYEFINFSYLKNIEINQETLSIKHITRKGNFLVKASDGSIFKIKIIKFDEQNEEIKLGYDIISK